MNQDRRDSIKITNDKGELLTMPSGRVYPPGGRITFETKQLKLSVASEGYVSGIAAGSFLDKKTGMHDLGFGLSIVDFLLEPERPDIIPAPPQYDFSPQNRFHGNIPKRYVEGPQICTQAKTLPIQVIQGSGFVAVRMHYRWNISYAPRDKAGSVWEQTLIIPENERFVLSSDRVTTVAESNALYLRVDMPGHIKHNEGAGFDHVYLSYNDPPILPSTEFINDFPPDARFRYRRGETKTQERFIRAYQVDLGLGKDEGPWLAGMTLEPADVYEAWCHQRGYICMIEELGGRPVKPGSTFGACYLLGWFDDLASMNAAYDRFKGWSGISLVGPPQSPTSYKGVKQAELTQVRIPQT